MRLVLVSRLLKGIKDGSISVKQALSLISEEAKRIGLNAQQAQQLTADLFRGAGEDGGALKIFEDVIQLKIKSDHCLRLKNNKN
jgi:hypothetical protein